MRTPLLAALILVLPASAPLAQVSPKPPVVKRPLEKPALATAPARPLDEWRIEFPSHFDFAFPAEIAVEAMHEAMEAASPMLADHYVFPDFHNFSDNFAYLELDQERVQQQARKTQERVQREMERNQERLREQLERNQERWQQQVEVNQERLQASVQRAQERAQESVRWATPEAAPYAYAHTIDSWGRAGKVTYFQGDPADSLYKHAHELLRRGEYRRAAATFKDIPTRYPSTAYQADALYWQAFALYRAGSTAELRSALAVLDQHRTRYPGVRNRADAAALTTRITGALAARGDATAVANLRNAATDSAYRCDSEEMQVRTAALNALSQSDPDGAVDLLQRTLARKDECTAPLRRTAVLLLGSKRKDAAAVSVLAEVARTDPSSDVRSAALSWLARMPGDEALQVLEEVSRDNSDERMQRTAVRALVQVESPRARQYVRRIVEREETPERIRMEAVSAFDKEKSGPEDIAWLRAVYSRIDNARLKARIVQTLGNIGGPELDQWLMALASNQEESSDIRRYALRHVVRTMPIAEIGKMYDASAERPLRESLIDALASRPESEATDKLIEIVKTGTDPRLRNQAINAITRKKDPRSTRLLMEIIDK